MKWWQVVSKNLKLLFRSKETAFTIIFGPLLIVLLVSAAFGSSQTSTLRVGAVITESTPLIEDVKASMEEEFRVSVFGDEESCVERIKTGELHTCISFSDSFRVQENGTNTVTFAVDYSRVNLVYQIIDRLSSEFNLQSSAITKTITDDLLERLAFVQREVRAQMAMADSIADDHDAIASSLNEGGDRLDRVDLSINFADLREVRGRVQRLSALVLEMNTEAEQAIEESIATLDSVKQNCEACSNATRELIDTSQEELENATEELDEIAAGAPEAVSVVNDIVDNAALAMEKVQNRFSEVAQASTDVQSGIQTSFERLEGASLKLSTLRGKLQHIDKSLQEARGLQSGSVSSPIRTDIEPVTSEGSQLLFTYPSIIMLVIMFLGLMLSSSLVVMDKTSKAAFRNFTTATRDEYHVLMSFVTTFFILLLQTLIVLVVSYYAVDASLFDNFGVTFLVLILGMTLFSFVGMIIGFLASTQEAAMMSSLSLGTVLLFISNLVLPIERMSSFVQSASHLNPYVVLSELLKQSILFGLDIRRALGQIGMLIGAILLLFIIMLLVQRSFKARFFSRQAKDLTAASFTTKRKVKPLKLGNTEVHDLFDLLETLDNMTRATFEESVVAKGNPVVSWVRNELRERRLSRKLKTKSKERMILALDKHLKRKTKKLQKK